MADAEWEAIARFHESALVTTAVLHDDGTQEDALVRQLLQNVSLERLFGVLQEQSERGDASRVKTVCDCINRVLACDGNADLFYQPEMVPLLVGGLQHPERVACVLTLDQLIGHLKKNPTAQQAQIVANPLVLDELCHVMAEDDVELATKASTVLDMFARVEGASLFKPTLDALKGSLSAADPTESSVEYMRYVEAIARICQQNDQHMQYAIDQLIIFEILKCLESTDVLFVMNIVDMLPLLCQTRIGMDYVIGAGTLQKLLAKTTDPFIGDNVLRLIGELAATAAQLGAPSWNWSDPMLTKAFLSTLEVKLESGKPDQQIAAMDALAAFASTSERELRVLLQHEQLCTLWLALGASPRLPVKVNCFHAVARILVQFTRVEQAADQVPDENATIWQLHERVFQALGENSRRPSTMALLMECLRQPFEEVRVAVFTLLRAVAAQNHIWGLRALQSYGGFFEFLFDRSTEPSKETREWKFAVADAVAASAFQQCLDASTRESLAQHLLRGPYVGNAPAETLLDAE